MSDNVYAADPVIVADLFAAGNGNGDLFQRVIQSRGIDTVHGDLVDPCRFLLNDEHADLFGNVRSNIVQSIRAFRVQDLADEALRLKQHFLYVHCAHATTKQEAMETIATSFLFPKHLSKNYDALYDCLTDLVAKSGSQPGFVIVLEALPATPKFDKEARETLLDVFREAAEFWADREVAFRVFYSFA